MRDEIDRSSLRHAEGEVSDVPAILSALAALASGRGGGVAMAEIHAAIAEATELLGAIIASGSERERAISWRALAGPAFVAAAVRVERCARDPQSSPMLRARAWEALRLIAPERLPESVDDDPAVALYVALCRLSVDGARASDALLERVALGLADRAVLDRVEAWAAVNDAPTPLRACATDLRGESPRTLPALAARLVNACDTFQATELAELLLDGAFPASGNTVDLASLSPKQGAVLAALAESDAVWTMRGALNGNLLVALGRHALPSGFDARVTIYAAIGLAPRRRVVVVTPREVRGAREVAAALGRDEWLDVPFVFSRNAPDFSEDIPEDPADFPPTVMRDFLAVSRPMRAMVLWRTCPIDTAAFYPQLSRPAFEGVARARGCEVVAPNLAYAEEVFDEAQWTSDEDAWP